MNRNEYLNEQNAKYLDCCANLMYFYLKSSNETILLNDVLSGMDGDINENKVILNRILKGLNKIPILGKVKLSYMDYVKLNDIIKNEKAYKFNIFPYVISIITLLATVLGTLVVIMIPSFIYVIAIIFLFIFLYFVFNWVK